MAEPQIALVAGTEEACDHKKHRRTGSCLSYPIQKLPGDSTGFAFEARTQYKLMLICPEDSGVVCVLD